MAGSDTPYMDLIKQKSDNGGKRFRGNAVVPPFSSDAVADIKRLCLLIDPYNADAAYGFFDLLQFDRPLVKCRILQLFCPVCNDMLRDFQVPRRPL